MLGFLGPVSLRDLGAPLPADHQRQYIPDGYSGTAATIQRMQQMVSRHKRDFTVRTLAGQLVQSCASKDYYCYARKLYEFCRDRIRYAFDPSEVELVESPLHVLKSGVADCDSIAVTLAALAESIGLHTRYVTIKDNPSHPNEFSHVYVRIYVPPSRYSARSTSGWIGADPTIPDKDFGWEPPEQITKDGRTFTIKRQEWPGSADESLADQDQLAPPSRSSPAVPRRQPSSPTTIGSWHGPRGGAGRLGWMDLDTLMPAQRDVTLTKLGLRGLDFVSLGGTLASANNLYNEAALLLNKAKTVPVPASMAAQYEDKLANWQNAFGQVDTQIMNSMYDQAEYVLNALKDDITTWLAQVEQSTAPAQREQVISIIESLPGPSPQRPSVIGPTPSANASTDWGTFAMLAAAGAVLFLVFRGRD